MKKNTENKNTENTKLTPDEIKFAEEYDKNYFSHDTTLPSTTQASEWAKKFLQQENEKKSQQHK